MELANKKITLVEKNRFNTSKDFDIIAISDKLMCEFERFWFK